MKQKIKQYSFWTGLSAAVVILITSISKAFGFEFEEKIVSDIIMSVCGVLVVLGVVNSPIKMEEEKEDDKDKTINSEENDSEEKVNKEKENEKTNND